MIQKIKSIAVFAWDFLVPRFVSEDVALEGSGTEWEDYSIVCSMADVQPGEVFDAVASVDAFQFLGIGITYQIGNFRPWGQA